MKKLKLGILNSSPLMVSYGGVGPFIKNLDPFLSEAFDVTYITLPPKLHDMKYFPKRLLYVLYLLFKMKSFKKQDVILSHVPEGSYIVSFTETPLIHIFHGNHNPMSQSRFWYGKYFKVIFDFFEARIIKKAKINYTVGKERPNAAKILNPIYHSITPKPIAERAGFIFVGRLEKIKNIDKIITIYSLLKENIKNDNLLYIAGKGTQELILKQMAEDMKLTDKVIFTGELTNNQLIEFVSNRRLLLMASSQEGLPMAIAESLSVGIPVISTDTGDISRAIQDNYNGFLLPIEFNTGDYINKIQYILDNYELFSANALVSADIFKAETVSKKLMDEIKSLVKKG
jgi:glycosyltransferase involved in cell wall biosynthesis